MAIYTYSSRTFQQAPGYTLLPITTDNYTDVVINNLYIRFAACYANLVYQYTANQLKGCDGGICSQAKYLLMALYVLRNWYNPVANAINPCIPYSVIQTIIENCIEICGNNACQVSSSLFSDGNFVPLGQVYNHPPTNISNLFPNIYFN